MFLEKDSCTKFIVYGEGNIKKVISAIDKGGIRIALVISIIVIIVISVVVIIVVSVVIVNFVIIIVLFWNI